jgi:DNA-binding response OmpR family regulator
MSEKSHILIIEDEQEFADMMKIRLQLAGYEATTATDTESGVEAILGRDYDLIILDLMMPGGGGFSILEQIKDIPEKAKIPVVIVTGKTIDPEVQVMVGAFRVAAIFSKPYDPVQFLDKIKSLTPPQKSDSME